MEKKQYIMPSVRVKSVNMLLMQNTSPTGPQIGEGEITDPEEELSKGVEMPADHDVWED